MIAAPAAAPAPRTLSRAGALGLAAAASLLAHGGLYAAARALPAAPRASGAPELVELELAPPPPAPPPPAPAAPPRVEPPAPRRVAMKDLPPPPREALPPPPSEPPPPAAAPARAAPRVGITLGSTATGGGFAVGVGNTLYGKASETAADPAEVKPYAADRTALPRPSSQPRLLERPEVPYPAAARRAGVEGQVILLLRIDAQGRVAAARVLSEPGEGLGDAARAAALRFRFSPALLEGEAVETELRFTYTFVLE